MKTYKEIYKELAALSEALFVAKINLSDKNTDGLPQLSLAIGVLRNCSFLLDDVCDSLENMED